MIILYEENESLFESLGLGVLRDAISCEVKETLEGVFELEMEYPISGSLYDQITIGRIIATKPNPFAERQPFRIAKISKPIDGTITVNAYHISYDMNGILVGPIDAHDINDTLAQLESKALVASKFHAKADFQSLTTFKTTGYYNMRGLLIGGDESICGVYKSEYLFDRFNVTLMKTRGSNKGAEIRYGKNMVDLTHDITDETLYNGVYPYYHRESSSADTSVSTDEFNKGYIVGTKPLQDGWLSFSEGGEPYHPINDAPIKIATQGEYFGKVFSWDTTKQRYSEKIVDQVVTLIEGVTAPEWIQIDWSGLPNIVVKAARSGYFKMATDTEYKHYDVGDIVFKGSIRAAMSNLMIYYSEVIPGQSTATEDVSSSVEHIDLSGEKILWVDTEAAHAMLYNRILPLDLTSEFKEDEEVNDENLKKKALEYIKKNKIGEYKYSTKVSFVDLRATSDVNEYKHLDTIELGDTVRVIYESMNVDVTLRVTSVQYNALLDEYTSIDLGEPPEEMSSSTVQTGDSISSLHNDQGYTTQQEVVDIVAKTVTADYISAQNAHLSKAMINELETERIRCTGILEASQFDVDKLVARLLIADNAEIKDTLEAGQIKVAGDITVKSGEISIQSEDGKKVFNVDREGNLVATSARIEGDIHASSGTIGGFSINDISISSNQQSMESSSENGVYIGPDGISLGKDFKIYPNGSVASSKMDYSSDPNSTQRKLTDPIENRTDSRGMNGYSGYVILGAFTAADAEEKVRKYAYGIATENLVLNITEQGLIKSFNEQGQAIWFSVYPGDTVVVYEKNGTGRTRSSDIFPDESWRYVYHYMGEMTVDEINTYIQDNAQEITAGLIFLVTGESGGNLVSPNIQGYTFAVTPGQYVVLRQGRGGFGDIRSRVEGSTEDPNGLYWSEYIFHDGDTDTSFFGLTSDGVLYANGAVISGDVNVKSGEISIEDSSGQKTFRVTRDGDITANSGTIGPLHVYQSSISVDNDPTDLENSYISSHQINSGEVLVGNRLTLPFFTSTYGTVTFGVDSGSKSPVMYYSDSGSLNARKIPVGSIPGIHRAHSTDTDYSQKGIHVVYVDSIPNGQSAGTGENRFFSLPWDVSYIDYKLSDLLPGLADIEVIDVDILEYDISGSAHKLIKNPQDLYAVYDYMWNDSAIPGGATPAYGQSNTLRIWKLGQTVRYYMLKITVSATGM